jgi:hypothetical protein
MNAKKFPRHPPHPHRNCWGCDRYCAAASMACGNGSVRTAHPIELFGDDWDQWPGAGKPPADAAPGADGSVTGALPGRA